MLDVSLDIVRTVSFVDLIIAYAIVERNDNFSESDERLDDELCQLEERERLLTRMIHDGEYDTDQYWKLQNQLDKICNRKTEISDILKYGNDYCQDPD